MKWEVEMLHCLVENTRHCRTCVMYIHHQEPLVNEIGGHIHFPAGHKAFKW